MTTFQRSPNQNARPEGVRVDAIVLHADAGQTDAGTISWLVSPVSKVSYHYLIGRDGSVHQFVADDQRAWHAGKSAWQGRADCNSYSIGVSFANDQSGEPFKPAALAAGVQLVADLCAKHRIPLVRVFTHAACATPPGRKHDPGPLFPLAKFLTDVGARLRPSEP